MPTSTERRQPRDQNGALWGVSIAERLVIELRRVGDAKRVTFGAGEHKLSDWMGENAFVAWMEHPAPWEIEPALIRELVLP